MNISKTKQKKSCFIVSLEVSLEVELEVSNEKAIDDGINMILRHFEPGDMGFGAGSLGRYSAKLVSRKIAKKL